MIELLYGSTKLRSSLIKLYFINNQELVLNSLGFTQVLSAKKPPAKIALVKTSQIEIFSTNILLIKYTTQLLSTILAFLALIKQNYRELKKYFKQTKIAALLDICFIIDKSNVFIKNVDMLLA